jgi:hypothetical protein
MGYVVSHILSAQLVDSFSIRILLIVDNNFLSIVYRTGSVRIYLRTYIRNLCT